MGQVSDNDWLFWHKQANGCGLKPTMSSLWSKVTHTHRDMVSCLFFPSSNQGPMSRFVNFFVFVFLESCWSVPDTHICQTKYEPESRFVSLSAFFSLHHFRKTHVIFILVNHIVASRSWMWMWSGNVWTDYNSNISCLNVSTKCKCEYICSGYCEDY